MVLISGLSASYHQYKKVIPTFVSYFSKHVKVRIVDLMCLQGKHFFYNSLHSR